MANKSLTNFFKYYIVGFVVCALKIDTVGKEMSDILWELFISFMYCNVIGIWTGMAGMFGQDLYFYLKKKYTK